MPRPVRCDLCGRDFFAASIAIHRKQCHDKQQYIPIACQFCDTEVRRCDMPKHIRGCPAARRATSAQRVAAARVGAIPTAVAPQPGMPPAQASDHRVPCAVCGRKFNADRVAKHQSICRKLAGRGGGSAAAATDTPPLPPPTAYTMPLRNPNEVTCDLCGRQFFKSSITIHRKQCKEKQQYMPTACPYCDAEVQERDLERHIRHCDRAPSPSARRAEKRETAGGALGLGCAAMPGGGSTHLVPCAVCGRTFASDRLAKHQSICRRVHQKRDASAPEADTPSFGPRSGPALYPAPPQRNPNEVDCDVCGRPFFKSSIEIHRRQCVAKMEYIPTACRFCDAEVKRKHLADHERQCRKAPTASNDRPPHRAAAEITLGLRASEQRTPSPGFHRGVGNLSVADDINGPSHMAPCAVCGRTFASDRLPKHQAICRRLDEKSRYA